MKYSKERFQKLKEESKKYYKSMKNVYCPYFDESIVFNVKGYQHLIFKSWNKSRPQADQISRLRLLPYAIKVLEKSNTLQEYTKRYSMINKDEKMDEHYYVFVAIIDDLRLKVVIRQGQSGAKYFYSVYPSWKVRNDEKILCFTDLNN